MTAIERWLGKESNLLLLASVVYGVFGIGYVCTPQKAGFEIVSTIGCFIVSGMFLLLRYKADAHAHKKNSTAAIKRRLMKKILTALFRERWYTTARRCSRIAWVLCSGAFFSYAGFTNIVVQPWHAILGVCAMLFVAGTIVLVFVSDRYTNVSEEEPSQKNSGEEK